MRRTGGLVACLAALVILSSPAAAETLNAMVPMSASQEVTPSPAPPATAAGFATLRVTVTRDAAGNITTGEVNFMVSFTFPGAITVTGLHIHEEVAGKNGSIVIDTGVSGNNSVAFPGGIGMLNLTAVNLTPAVLQRLVADPAGFYVNLHTTDNPGGAIRGQISFLMEALAETVAMTPGAEVNPSPAPPANALGTGTITANPTRNSEGAVTGGSVTFSVFYNFQGGPITITGLHIHRGAAGTNGPIVIETGVSATNPVISATGVGTINVVVPNPNRDTFRQLLADPANFYVNLHTSVNPGGAIRGQLATLHTPLLLRQSSEYLLTTGGGEKTITLAGANFEPNSRVLINGQAVRSTYDFLTGQITATIPADRLTSAGTLLVQVRSNSGLASVGQTIVVANAAMVNSNPVSTVDAGRFGSQVAPESIAASFGTSFASQSQSGTTTPLPTTIDGTSLFFNGVAAPLFFVSVGQINYQIPPGTVPGMARVVVVGKDGTISQGQATVSDTAPAIFTRNSGGTGAPAAVASADGTTFNIQVSNADGTPVPLDPGGFVALFGTGIRFAPNSDRNATNGVTESVTISAGGMEVAPLFAGAQGVNLGMDQVNFQIPAAFAGKGEVDLIVSTVVKDATGTVISSKAANTVRISIK